MPFRPVAPLLVLTYLIPMVGPTAAAQPQEGGTSAALLAASCSGCHRKAASDDTNAVGEVVFPQIYGRPAAEIRDAMLAFRTDERAATVMNRIAKGYSPAEIDVLATYLSEQPATGTGGPGK
ncbi:MAG: cytochrome C [Methyloceanibacter sp.]|nr:cytochrome C [Methyloceanibacter sp.]